jgi:hypothetical protein
MKQLFKIDESEKRRILEMHENATRRNYLMEQGTPAPATTGNQKTLPKKETTFNTITDFYGIDMPVKTSLLKMKSADDINKLTSMMPQNQELVDEINSKVKAMGSLGKETTIGFPSATDENTKNLTYKYLNVLMTAPIWNIVTRICGEVVNLPEDTGKAMACTSGINYEVYKKAMDFLLTNNQWKNISEDALASFKDAYNMLGTGVKNDSGYQKIFVQIQKAPLITALSSIANEKYQSF